jgi:hypothetical protein
MQLALNQLLKIRFLNFGVRGQFPILHGSTREIHLRHTGNPLLPKLEVFRFSPHPSIPCLSLKMFLAQSVALP